MKKITILIVVSAFLLTGWTFAQPVPGKKVEFSVSGYFSSFKYENDHDATDFLNIPLRLGIFLWKGLEFEPEVVLTIPDRFKDTGIVFRANLAYHFRPLQKTLFFVLAGGGYGNAIEAMTLAADQEKGVTVFNLGAGIKQIIGDSAALRLEYRFSRSSWSVASSTWWNPSSYLSEHAVFAGVSLFF